MCSLGALFFTAEIKCAFFLLLLFLQLFRNMDALLVADDQEPFFYRDDVPPSLAPPPLMGIVNFDLGVVQGIPLTFAGSAPTSVSSNGVLERSNFVRIAGAEASPNTTRMGLWQVLPWGW